MASVTKRTWKLQEFAAHDSNVNCLALGHKSGRVLATGGDDKKVNLWAVGKHGCIMSLSGHTTPIECVKFNHTEELVCAGSQMGAMKVWDLEAAKLVKTLTGHRGGISCIDFHPYGDFVVSGSGDCTIKLWDARRKGCIFTFKGHSARVNSIKFSPDGQWVASSGDDSTVKVWDLRAGKTIHEFVNHTNSVTSVEFHPHEFLLASGGLDRTVYFWDLENFQMVSSEKDVGAVKCLWFNPDGECLFAGVTDGLKVLGWEPSRVFDSVPVGWGKVYDIATAQYQIVGASFHLTNVSIYIVDLKRVHPFGGPAINSPPSPFSHGQSVRKSFSKEKPISLRTKATIDVKTIEESTSGTDPEEDFGADITFVKDYTEIFQPNRSLARTPPAVEPFQAPESDLDPTEPQIICSPEDEFKSLSLRNMEIRSQPTSPSTPPLKSPPEPVKSLPVEIYPTHQPAPKNSVKYERPTNDHHEEKRHMVPSDISTPIGLDLEDFLPPRLRTSNQNNRLDCYTENELFEKMQKDNDPTMAILLSREKTLRSLHQYFRNGDPKAAMEKVKSLNEISIFHDILKAVMVRRSFWSLDMCVITLPKIQELLKSKYEVHILTGCEALKKILKGFSNVIRTNMQCPVGSFSVDIPREERFQKCKKSYGYLMEISAFLLAKPPSSSESGRIIKELQQELTSFSIDV